MGDRAGKTRLKALSSKGILPLEHDLDQLAKEEKLTEEIEGPRRQ